MNFVPAAGTHVVGIGDYNGDGIDDLLWSNNGTITQSLGRTDGSFVDNSAQVNIHTGLNGTSRRRSFTICCSRRFGVAERLRW